MKSADLHLHTTFSDSTLTPVELVEGSIAAGLSAIAVVDHDNIGGIQPALDAAVGKGLEVIPGIELTAEYDSQEIHILGYFLDYKDGVLIKKLDFLRSNRVDRIYKMVDKLKTIGVNLNPETVFSLAQDGTVGRLHVARALVKDGIVANVYEAFQKYIGDKCPGYVLGFRFTPREAIELILGSGGIPVLAHPYILDDDELIPEFVKYGLRGLEVYYPEHSQSMVNFYLNLARELKLLVTGGSDCHGDAKPNVAIGAVKVDYSLVERLKEARPKIK